MSSQKIFNLTKDGFPNSFICCRFSFYLAISLGAHVTSPEHWKYKYCSPIIIIFHLPRWSTGFQGKLQWKGRKTTNPTCFGMKLLSKDIVSVAILNIPSGSIALGKNLFPFWTSTQWRKELLAMNRCLWSQKCIKSQNDLSPGSSSRLKRRGGSCFFSSAVLLGMVVDIGEDDIYGDGDDGAGVQRGWLWLVVISTSSYLPTHWIHVLVIWERAEKIISD